MEEATQILYYVAYLLPAIVVGVIAYYFFKGHTANEEGRRRYLVQKEAQKTILPMRLQAYERITLFLERLDPNKKYIYCPFEEKEECKHLGGKWDNEKYMWYIPEGINNIYFKKSYNITYI